MTHFSAPPVGVIPSLVWPLSAVIPSSMCVIGGGTRARLDLCCFPVGVSKHVEADEGLATLD